MGWQIKIIALLLGILFFITVMVFVKRSSFRTAYALLWIGVAAFLISIPLLEPIYKWLATSVLGILDARHIIYIGLIGFLLIYIFYLTIKISQMADHIQALISFTAILEKEIGDRCSGETSSGVERSL